MPSDSRVRSLTWFDRFQAGTIGILGFAAISLIGRTLRWSCPNESHVDEVHRAGKRAIFTVWHGRMFPAAYHWKNRKIVMLVSTHRDAEAMAQCILRLGFGVARGSSSRGAADGLAKLQEAIESGHDVGFTVDGPRGPRYFAKPGPAILAIKTGSPILCTHLAVRRKIELKTWDRFQIPLPFTSAVVLIGEPIWPPMHPTSEQLHAIQNRVQSTMEELQKKGDTWWDRKTDRI